MFKYVKKVLLSLNSEESRFTCRSTYIHDYFDIDMAVVTLVRKVTSFKKFAMFKVVLWLAWLLDSSTVLCLPF